MLTNQRNEIKEEFNNFLASNFAQTENEWKPWLVFLGKQYVCHFIDGIEVLKKEIKPYLRRKKPEFSLKEISKIKVILNLKTLFCAIKVDYQNHDLLFDFEAINRFELVKEEKEKQNIRITYQEIESDLFKNYGEKKSSSFSLLHQLHSTFLSFYHNPKFREYFFLNFILKNNLNVGSINSQFPNQNHFIQKQG